MGGAEFLLAFAERRTYHVNDAEGVEAVVFRFFGISGPDGAGASGVLPVAGMVSFAGTKKVP